MENNIKPIDALKIFLGVVGTLAGVSVILVLLVVLNKLVYTEPQIAGVKTDDERYAILTNAQAQDQHTLTSYGWVNKEKGIVRIPIQLAMDKLLEEPK